jgi:hypothetical protein
MNRLQGLLAASVACSTLEGCMLLDRSTQVSLASDPPGAKVLVNDRESGFVTPCILALDPGENARIDLEYPGYVTARRILTPDQQVYAVLGKDMYIRPSVWRFPLWLNTRDLFVPVKYDRTLSPGRLYVKLERAADS